MTKKTILIVDDSTSLRAAVRIALDSAGYDVVEASDGQDALGKLDGIALVLLGQFKPFMQLLLERAVAHLLEDICVPRLVDLEGFVAVGADDFVHGD